MTNVHLSLNTVCSVYHLLYKKKKVKHSSLQKAKDYYAYLKILANENGKAWQVKKNRPTKFGFTWELPFV